MPDQRRTANRNPDTYDDVRAVIVRHALFDLGKVVLCRPRVVELTLCPGGRPEWRNNDGKVCYPDLDTATTAADEINAFPHTDNVRAYQCPRGGHAHHVTDRGDYVWARKVHRMAASVRRWALIHAAQDARP